MTFIRGSLLASTWRLWSERHLMIVSEPSKTRRKSEAREGSPATCSLFVLVLQLPWLGNLTARQPNRCSRQRLRNLDGRRRPSGGSRTGSSSLAGLTARPLLLFGRPRWRRRKRHPVRRLRQRTSLLKRLPPPSI